VRPPHTAQQSCWSSSGPRPRRPQRGLAQGQTEIVSTQGHRLRSADFIDTLIVEATIHYLDLTLNLPASPAPASALLRVRNVLDGLFGTALPLGWDDVRIRSEGHRPGGAHRGGSRPTRRPGTENTPARVTAEGDPPWGTGMAIARRPNALCRDRRASFFGEGSLTSHGRAPIAALCGWSCSGPASEFSGVAPGRRDGDDHPSGSGGIELERMEHAVDPSRCATNVPQGHHSRAVPEVYEAGPKSLTRTNTPGRAVGLEPTTCGLKMNSLPLPSHVP
jgi:hypothetical protein